MAKKWNAEDTALIQNEISDYTEVVSYILEGQ